MDKIRENTEHVLSINQLKSTADPEFKEEIEKLQSFLDEKLKELQLSSATLSATCPTAESAETGLRICTSTEALLQCLRTNLEILQEFPQYRLPISLISFEKILRNLTAFISQYQVSSSSSNSTELPLLEQPLNSSICVLKSSISQAKASLASIAQTYIQDYPHFPTLLLNVISSFLYMGNFYLLAVSAKSYVSDLGEDSTFSGYLTAVNWLAAVLFAFPYSYWSNYQFKVPTVFCAALVVLGNLLYVLAYDFGSAYVLLFGRLLLGVGGPRVINRRYILTYVSERARTKWATMYVAGSILGMACGPFAAAGLAAVHFTFLGITLKEYNSCAFVMCFIWIVYLVLTVLFFKEPEIVQQETKTGEGTVDDRSIYPSLLVLWCLFFPKLVQETFIIITPIITSELWDWSITTVGLYLAIVSFIVSPIHIVISYTSKFIKDRQYILIALAICLIGSLLFVDYSSFSMPQYYISSLILYLATNMTDGVSTSLTSKLLPGSISKGMFNAGLLATLAGSFGRAVGGLLIGLAGALSDDIQNVLFAPLSLISLLSLILFIYYYKHLI